MNRFLVLVLLTASTSAFGAKQKESEFNVSVHVQSSHLVNRCDSALGHSFCGSRQQLEVVIDGKKYQLTGTENSDSLLRIDDYKARVASDDVLNSQEYKRVYEILLPPSTMQRYSVTGESE